MKFSLSGSNNDNFGKSVKDLDGFCRCGRFIILSEVTSNSIPNILELVFDLMPSGIGNIFNPVSKKTKVTLINISEIYGDVHGRKDTRNRNVYIHYGFCDCGIDQVNGETPVTFTDMDWNVISDTPSKSEHGDLNGLTDINVSYDNKTTGGLIFRDSGTSCNQILIPSPEYYDEKDMLLIGDKEENYYDTLQENKESKYYTSFDKYYNNLYRKSLNSLIDKYTKVVKLNINIENLSSVKSTDSDNFNNFIQDLAAYAKYSLETCGFCGAEIILGGSTGFNITNIKSQMDLSNMEAKIYLRLLYNKIEELNYSIENKNYTILMRFSYSKVDVRIVDKTINRAEEGTDCLSEDLSNNLKVNTSTIEDSNCAYA